MKIMIDSACIYDLPGEKEGLFDIVGPFGTYKTTCRFIEVESDALIEFLHFTLKIGDIFVSKPPINGIDIKIMVQERTLLRQNETNKSHDKLYEQRDQRGL